MTQVAEQLDYPKVRAAFIVKGTSFSRWCAENGVSRAWAIAVLNSRQGGPAAISLRSRIIEAAGCEN